jgi:hypothetical protein
VSSAGRKATEPCWSSHAAGHALVVHFRPPVGRRHGRYPNAELLRRSPLLPSALRGPQLASTRAWHQAGPRQTRVGRLRFANRTKRHPGSSRRHATNRRAKTLRAKSRPVRSPRASSRPFGSRRPMSRRVARRQARSRRRSSRRSGPVALACRRAAEESDEQMRACANAIGDLSAATSKPPRPEPLS